MLSSPKLRTLFGILFVASACASRVAQPSTPEADIAHRVQRAEAGGNVAGSTPLSPIDDWTLSSWTLQASELAPALVEPGPTAIAEQAPVHVELRDVNTGDTLGVDITREGLVAAEQLGVLEAFLACRRSGRMHALAPGALRVLAVLTEEYPGHVIEIISGYRARPYGVRDSKHFAGHALDLRVRGVKLSKVRDFVWKHLSDVGVGYYMEQNFLHVDYRPDSKDTAWSSPHENAAREYNPRWALRIRPPWREPSELGATVATSALAAGPSSGS